MFLHNCIIELNSALYLIAQVYLITQLIKRLWGQSIKLRNIIVNTLN